MKQVKLIQWWENKGGFFGQDYIVSDSSKEGHFLNKSRTLQERTTTEVDGIMNVLNLPTSAEILDLPCGYGRHSIELARRGFKVTGIDINDEHLRKAREDFLIAESLHPLSSKPKFIKGDMRRLDSTLLGKFDAVINMFFSFGFFKDDLDNVLTMHQFYNSLKDEGKMLIHTIVSPEMISRRGVNYKSILRQVEGGLLHIDEYYDPQTKRLNGSWRIDCNGSVVASLTPYSVRIYSADEFKQMAKEVGFRDIEVCGSFDRSKFTPDSKELIIIAKK